MSINTTTTYKNTVNRSSKNIYKKSIIPKSILKNWDLYLIILPVILYFVVFKYFPMYGIQIAFKNFSASKGIWESPWVGFTHFIRFFNSYSFPLLIKNTLLINIYGMLFSFPFPILFALLINEVRNKYFKKSVQTITYIPHFLSVVVLVGMVVSFLSPSTGIINNIIRLFGMEEIYFMIEPKWFRTIYITSDIWQNMGWNSIIYIAALAGVDVELYEAAVIDGASKIKRLLYVTIPSIMPTITIMFILNMGKIMDIGFTKIFLMQNNLNKPSSDVISTYVYNVGLLGTEFSFSTAVDLFNSIINFILIILVNKFSKAIGETSLW